MKIHNWAEIEHLFGQNILLGNGSSIAIDEHLSYRSLYRQVCSSGRLNDEITELFGFFDTTNFEFVMKLLLEAGRVNEALNIDDKKTRDYYVTIRDSLINTIRDIHPSHKDVESLLPKMADFLANFKTVLSLNYDLLVYWSMLVGNNTLRCQWFKDCFVAGEFEKDFDYLYKPHPPAKGSTLVFYPHGNIFFATDASGNEEKLAHSENEFLLDTILNKWKEKDYIPLFVSEGSTTEKFHAITRSSYLNSVYDSVLSTISGSLVIYGWSAGEQDEHVFNALDHKGITDIAISVHTSNPKYERYCDEVKDRLRRTHNLRSSQVYFFDSQSAGCWIY